MFWRKKVQEHAAGTAWFNYSIALPDIVENERNITVISNFLFKNTGTKSLQNPMICIRIKPPQNAYLGGKIGAASQSELTIDHTMTESWHYIQDNWKETTIKSGEHWLKPNQTYSLKQNETLVFAHELDIPTIREEKYILIEGYFYCDELKDGVRTLNNIMINF